MYTRLYIVNFTAIKKWRDMSNAIRYWRKRHKPFITQKELSEQIGIDRPLLSKIENPNIHVDPDEVLDQSGPKECFQDVAMSL